MREITNSYVELAQMICDTLLRDDDFRRLICYDGPDTLSKAAPTVDEAQALIAGPEPFESDGRRIYFQELLPTVTDSKTSLMIWIPGLAEQVPGVTQKVTVKIRVMNHLALETIHDGTKTISRSLALVQRVHVCLCDELDDPSLSIERYLAGIGPLRMAEVVRVSDGRERCGYDITLETSW